MCAKDECTNVRENTRVRVFCSHDQHDALFLLQRELSHGTWRVESVSSDTFQTTEVCTCSFPDCTTALLANAMSGRSYARYASLADTL